MRIWIRWDKDGLMDGKGTAFFKSVNYLLKKWRQSADYLYFFVILRPQKHSGSYTSNLQIINT